MSRPLLSVVIPTIGRPSLTLTLDSLDAQAEAELVEVLVVADVHGGLTPALEQARDHVLEERDGERYRWLQYDGGMHCVGQPQRMIGGRTAMAPWVWYSQDDNIAAAGAVSAILRAAAQQTTTVPMFGRWLSAWREVIWREEKLTLGNIDADCLVLPHWVAQRVEWGLRYEGDFDAAQHAARLVNGQIAWLDAILSISKPDAEHYWWRQAEATA